MVEPEDYAKIFTVLGEYIKDIPKAETFDTSIDSMIHTFDFRNCKLILHDTRLTDNRIVLKGFVEIYSNKMKYIENLKSFFEEKIGTKLESKVKKSSQVKK